MSGDQLEILLGVYVIFSDAQGQLTPQSAVEFHQNSELIQAFMVVLVTCKNEGTRVL